MEKEELNTERENLQILKKTAGTSEDSEDVFSKQVTMKTLLIKCTIEEMKTRCTIMKIINDAQKHVKHVNTLVDVNLPSCITANSSNSVSTYCKQTANL